ncbi:MAG: glycosyltransferase, partial [Rectinema sp.]
MKPIHHRHSVNVHIYPSPFEHESRILKITKSLADAGLFDTIYIFAIWKSGLQEEEPLDEIRKVIRIRVQYFAESDGVLFKVLKIAEWAWRIFKWLRAQKVQCVNCHSLSVLPLCAVLKIRHKAKLVYDTHELETETANSAGFRKLLAKMTERVLVPFIDKVVVVNSDIARWYQNHYRLEGKISI